MTAYGAYIEARRTLTLPLSAWADIIECMWKHSDTKEYAMYMIDEMVIDSASYVPTDIDGGDGGACPPVLA